MIMKLIAVYAGTFDPVTNGHLDIIERASKMFDTLYVTILNNPAKENTKTFSVDERMTMLRESTKHLNNVIVDYSDELTIGYAAKKNASVLVRGLRATMDFENELQLAYANQYLNKNIESVFLMTRQEYSFISSGTVKEIASHGGSVEGLAPICVQKALKEKFK